MNLHARGRLSEESLSRFLIKSCQIFSLFDFFNCYTKDKIATTPNQCDQIGRKRDDWATFLPALLIS